MAELPSPKSGQSGAALSNCVPVMKLVKASYLSSVVLWARRAAELYQQAVANTHASFQAEAERFRALCDEWMQRVRAQEQDVRREMEKLGLA